MYKKVLFYSEEFFNLAFKIQIFLILFFLNFLYSFSATSDLLVSNFIREGFLGGVIYNPEYLFVFDFISIIVFCISIYLLFLQGSKNLFKNSFEENEKLYRFISFFMTLMSIIPIFQIIQQRGETFSSFIGYSIFFFLLFLISCWTLFYKIFYENIYLRDDTSIKIFPFVLYILFFIFSVYLLSQILESLGRVNTYELLVLSFNLYLIFGIVALLISIFLLFTWFDSSKKSNESKILEEIQKLKEATDNNSITKDDLRIHLENFISQNPPIENMTEEKKERVVKQIIKIIDEKNDDNQYSRLVNCLENLKEPTFSNEEEVSPVQVSHSGKNFEKPSFPQNLNSQNQKIEEQQIGQSQKKVNELKQFILNIIHDPKKRDEGGYPILSFEEKPDGKYSIIGLNEKLEELEKIKDNLLEIDKLDSHLNLVKLTKINYFIGNLKKIIRLGNDNLTKLDKMNLEKNKRFFNYGEDDEFDLLNYLESQQ